jgi:hypothetical protein
MAYAVQRVGHQNAGGLGPAEHSHGRTARCQCIGERFANAATTSGDDRDLALKFAAVT